MKDPIKLQCLSIEIHALLDILTDIAENNNEIDVDDVTRSVSHTIFNLSHWLKEECNHLNRDYNPTVMSELNAVAGQIESLATVIPWRTDDDINHHIIVTLSVIGNLAREFQEEIKRLGVAYE